MPKYSALLHYGTEPVRYEILPSRRRRTMTIEVHPDLRVLVHVPERYRYGDVTAWVTERAFWVARQLERFRRRGPVAPPYGYVDGELHAYLGEQYPLRLVNDSTMGVRLAEGQLVVHLRPSDEVSALLRAWYFERAAEVFPAVLKECHAAFFERRGHALPPVVVKAMTRRWGSMSPRGRMALSVDLVRTPLRCVELVVTHELCHLEQANHGPAFYQLLAEALPDWHDRRASLRAFLSRIPR